MYIDTHSKMSMENSICHCFNIPAIDLYKLFEYAEEKAQQNKYTDGDRLDMILNKFIETYLPGTLPDEILFFHLCRRLNTAQNCNVGNNLFDLLSSDTAMSAFLKEHDVEFLICDKHLELMYKHKKVSLEDTSQEHIPYLRWRLGYNSNRIDFCYNGFMLKDLLYRNSYARELYDVPEFLGILVTFLNRKDIGNDYFYNSKYFCMEYCVPIEKIMFDEKDDLSHSDKAKYLFYQVLNRLYEYHVRDIRYMYDHDNPIIRLSDNDTMEEKYFVKKEEVTWEMLR